MTDPADRSLRAALAALVPALAAELARALAAELGQPHGDLVDQHGSVLGARRHIGAIRRGELPGYQLGRRWIARRDDVDAYARSLAARAPVRRSRADALAEELDR